MLAGGVDGGVCGPKGPSLLAPPIFVKFEGYVGGMSRVRTRASQNDSFGVVLQGKFGRRKLKIWI